MAAPLRISLGAPGIYRFRETPLRGLTGVRMDVAAFVGVAPRGPARMPVVNEKWPAGAGIQFGSFSLPGDFAPR